MKREDLLVHRSRAEIFLRDKLAYHGFTPGIADGHVFSLYFNVVYRHCVNMTLAYNSEPGPGPKYNPIVEAWRSRRTTTKQRDYVLAVFPDIDGYRIPAGALGLSFSQLLLDAINQPAIYTRLNFVAKIPKGLGGHSSRTKESFLPWLLDDPIDIGVAYDTFAADVVDATSKVSKMEDITVWALPGSVQLHGIEATDSGLEALIHDWKATADLQQHVVLLSTEGPCTGVIRQVANNSKGNNDVESGLLQQHFAEGFMDVAVSQWLTNEKMSMLKLRTKDVIPVLNSTKFCEETFARELRHFLVCLICSTSLITADKVLDVGVIVRSTTPYGSLLGVVHKATRLEARKDQLVLLCGDRWYMQGFFISLRTEGGVSVRGRTVIPNKGVWDFLEAFTTPRL